ncbi:MAG: hypothetical protein ACXW5U_07465 [Thermoanaerobaculia bacterium]
MDYNKPCMTGSIGEVADCSNPLDHDADMDFPIVMAGAAVIGAVAVVVNAGVQVYNSVTAVEYQQV